MQKRWIIMRWVRKILLICMSVLWTIPNQKGSTRTRTNHMSVLQKIKNQKGACQCISFGWDRIKNFHISVSTSEVKEASNETKDEEPLVEDNSVINATRYFKLFECGKKYWTNLIPCVNEHVWQPQRKILICNFLSINERAWKIRKKNIIQICVTP